MSVAEKMVVAEKILVAEIVVVEAKRRITQHHVPLVLLTDMFLFILDIAAVSLSFPWSADWRKNHSEEKLIPKRHREAVDQTQRVSMW